MDRINPRKFKRVRHHDIPNHAHELTFSTYQRRPVLLLPGIPQIVLAAIGRCRERDMARLIAFVVMPEHIHILLAPIPDEDGNPTAISDLLRAIKRPSSFRIKQHLTRTKPSLVDHLTIRERPGKATFRFWQQGGGYDRNLTNPEAIRSSIAYIHRNPVRRGLCNAVHEWEWSSHAQWQPEKSPMPDWMPSIDRCGY